MTGRGSRARTTRLAATLAVLVGAVAASSPMATADDSSDLRRAEKATARFHSLTKAEASGYAILQDTAGHTCIEHPTLGGMGTHYVNGALVGDGLIDAAKPEALLYDQTGSRNELLGVEYVVFQSQWTGAEPPSLFGREFALVPAGNRYGLDPFYELHAWIWRENPVDMFADYNPHISC